jgi:ATP-binding cassette subfamily B protein
VREDLEKEKFGARANSMAEAAFKAAFLVAFMNPMLGGISQGARALAIWLGGEQVIANAMSIGDLIAFTQYLTLVVTPLALLAIVVPFLLRGETSAQRLFEVYDAKPDVTDTPDAKTVDPARIKGRVEFDNVTFAFRRPDGKLDPPALKNVSLTIEPGERVGFLGATGAGKSALVNLIPRFYDVQEGRITIDGIDVRDFPQEELRQTVGMALQEAVLFQGDVRFNLKFGNPDCDDDLMIGAATAADAHGFVSNLPEQYDAPVARRGYNFSGGQRQRLSMARALTTQPRIVILDDSTSALDVATESRVQSSIPKFSQDATTIYVAQRISAVIDLDKIFLLENGRIVDCGKHEELLQRSPLYGQIYESQLGGLPDEAERVPANGKATEEVKA